MRVVEESRVRPAPSGLSESEWQSLVRACAEVPSPSTPPELWGEDGYPDYVTNLMLTVLDLQLRNVIVNNAIEHYGTAVGSVDSLPCPTLRFCSCC